MFNAAPTSDYAETNQPVRISDGSERQEAKAPIRSLDEVEAEIAELSAHIQAAT